jgi:hypothetical protein
MKKTVAIILLLAVLLFAIVATAYADAPGNDVFPLECLRFGPGRDVNWISGHCVFLDTVLYGVPLIP